MLDPTNVSEQRVQVAFTDLEQAKLLFTMARCQSVHLGPCQVIGFARSHGPEDRPERISQLRQPVHCEIFMMNKRELANLGRTILKNGLVGYGVVQCEATDKAVCFVVGI